MDIIQVTLEHEILMAVRDWYVYLDSDYFVTNGTIKCKLPNDIEMYCGFIHDKYDAWFDNLQQYQREYLAKCTCRCQGNCDFCRGRKTKMPKEMSWIGPYLLIDEYAIDTSDGTFHHGDSRNHTKFPLVIREENHKLYCFGIFVADTPASYKVFGNYIIVGDKTYLVKPNTLSGFSCNWINIGNARYNPLIMAENPAAIIPPRAKIVKFGDYECRVKLNDLTARYVVNCNGTRKRIVGFTFRTEVTFEIVKRVAVIDGKIAFCFENMEFTNALPITKENINGVGLRPSDEFKINVKYIDEWVKITGRSIVGCVWKYIFIRTVNDIAMIAERSLNEETVVLYMRGSYLVESYSKANSVDNNVFRLGWIN